MNYKLSKYGTDNQEVDKGFETVYIVQQARVNASANVYSGICMHCATQEGNDGWVEFEK